MVNKAEYKVLVSEDDDSVGEEEVNPRYSRELSHPLSECSSDSEHDDSRERDKHPLSYHTSPANNGTMNSLRTPDYRSPERTPDYRSPERASRQDANLLIGGASFTGREADFEHNHVLGVSIIIALFLSCYNDTMLRDSSQNMFSNKLKN